MTIPQSALLTEGLSNQKEDAFSDILQTINSFSCFPKPHE